MASSSSYLVNVPKLRGRENYSEWCFAAENFLVLEGMVGCIKPDPDQPPGVADDAKTRAKLILIIDPVIYVHIKNIRISKELWDRLKTLFDDSGFTRRISLLRNLISIRLENCTLMTSYVTQLVEEGQKLEATGFGLNDEWIGSIMLAGLSEKYMPMIMAIEHSGMIITSDAMKAKLMDMEPEDKKSEQCILVGYPDNIKGYRIYNPSTRSITTSRDVIIIEEDSSCPVNIAEIEVIDDKAKESRTPQTSVGDISDTSKEGSFVSGESVNDLDETYIPDKELMRCDE